MQNEENKKNGPIDYSKFFEEEKLETEATTSLEKKKSFLINLKNFWIGSDKKTKIEIIVFLIIIFLIIIILTSYMIKSNLRVVQNSLYASLAG